MERPGVGPPGLCHHPVRRGNGVDNGTVRTCAWSSCSASFQYVRSARGGRSRIYCSIACRVKAQNNHPMQGVPRTTRAWPRSEEIAAEVCNLYLSGLSAEDVAARFGKPAETIRRTLRGRGVVLRDRNAPTRAKLLRGGRVAMRGGYIGVLLRPDDPLYAMGQRYANMQHGAYALEHRVVIARALGRPLEPWEDVHHKNGVRDDNRVENLELWAVPARAGGRSQPRGQRVADLATFVAEHYPEELERLGWTRPAISTA